MLMALVALYVKVMAPADKNVNDEHSVTSLLVDMMSLPMHSVTMTSCMYCVGDPPVLSLPSSGLQFRVGL